MNREKIERKLDENARYIADNPGDFIGGRERMAESVDLGKQLAEINASTLAEAPHGVG